MDTHDDNVHIQELRKLFDDCCADGSDKLSQHGLEELCLKLHLAEHTQYIVGQILPRDDDQVSFATFKSKFIQLLPEVVELSVADDSLNNSPRHGDADDSIEDILSHAASPSKRSLHSSARRKRWKKSRSPSRSLDDDTTHDILSDDEFPESLTDIPTANGRTPQFLHAQIFEDASAPTGLELAAGNSVEQQMNEVRQTIDELGLAQDGYMGRYELRILCQHIGLVDMSADDLNNLFVQLDKNGDGRISLEEFFRGFPKSPLVSPRMQQQRRSSSASQQAFSAAAIGSVTLFSAVSTDSKGHARTADVLRYWDQLGIANGKHIFERMGVSLTTTVSVREVEQALEHELQEMAMASEVVLAAVLTFKAEVSNLRNALEQCERKNKHCLQEVEQLHARNALLVDEMEQSQSNLEAAAARRIRETEERCKQEMTRVRAERDAWVREAGEVDERERTMKKREEALLVRVNKVEKENALLVGQLERVRPASLDEKSERSDAPGGSLKRKHAGKIEPAPGATAASLIAMEGQLRVWKQKAELGVVENRMLRDQVDELRARLEPFVTRIQRSSSAATRLHYSSTTLVAASNATGRQMKALTRKNDGTVKESTDIESEQEPTCGFRIRIKRRLKRRQRRELSARRQQKWRENCGGRTMRRRGEESSEEQGASYGRAPGREKASSTLVSNAGASKVATLERQFDEERKIVEHQHKVEMAKLEDDLLASLDAEKRRLQEQLERVVDSHEKEKREVLSKQEMALNEKFEEERREQEIRWASERNVMERGFAEEKMEIMSRLQQDFEVELRRARAATAASSAAVSTQSPKSSGTLDRLTSLGRRRTDSVASASLEQLESENRRLREDMNGLRNGYEHRIVKMSEDFEAQRLALEEREWTTLEELPEKLRERFEAIVEEYRLRVRNEQREEMNEILESFQRQRVEMQRAFEEEREKMREKNAGERGEREAVEEERKRVGEERRIFDEERRTFDEERRVVDEERRKVEEEHRKFDEERRVLEEEHKKLEEERRIFVEERRVLEEELSSVDAMKAKLDDEERQLLQEHELFGEERRTLDEERRMLNEELEAFDEERTASSNRHAELSTQLVTLESVLQKKNATMDVVESQLEAARADASRVEEERDRLRSELAAAKADAEEKHADVRDCGVQTEEEERAVKFARRRSCAVQTGEEMERRQRCERCALLEARVRDLETSVLTGESGIDDDAESSGLESFANENPSALLRENRRLKRKLDDAQTKLLELRTVLSVAGSQQTRRDLSPLATNASTEQGRRRAVSDAFVRHDDERLGDASERVLVAQVTYLEADNFLLRARLREMQSLAAEQVGALKQQLCAHVKSSGELERMYAQNGELLVRMSAVRRSTPALNQIRAHLREICVELAKREQA